MLTRYIYILCLTLLGFLAVSSVPYVPTSLMAKCPDTRFTAMPLNLSFQPQDTSDEYILTRGILTAKIKEQVWYQCGERLPQEVWYDKAVEIAIACVHTARPLGVDPVGQLATWQQESRLDPCALGTHPRKWAVKHRLLPRQRSMSYTKAEVEHVLNDRRFRASFPQVDLGLAQLLYPTYTRGATVDEILSTDGAVYSARELAYRGHVWHTKAPWIYWPGYKSKNRARIVDWWVHDIMEIEFLTK